MKQVNHLTNFLKNFFLLKFSPRKRPLHRKEILKNWYQPATLFQNSSEPIITWIGQATFLLQVAGLNILTDPIFFHLSPLFFRRLIPPGIAIEKLPSIDAIIISHDHADHMHKKTLKKLAHHNPVVLAPH